MIDAAEIERLSRQPPEDVEKVYPGSDAPEAVKMLVSIQRGSVMGPNDGWFGPARSRYNWEWLAQRHGINPDEAIPADKFQGPRTWLARLDRNRDGKIAAEDLDWSDRNPWVQEAYLTNRMFRRMDPNGDGSITRAEWHEFFDRASEGKDLLLYEDFRDALLAGVSSSFAAGDMPSKDVLLQGLIAGEIGSIKEGPAIDAPAPDFTLKTHDGKQEIRLADVIGPKPIVLVFGNYTCGPFRSMFPGVDAVRSRFKDDATFLAVYVREAHPTDGWHMEANARLGVKAAQPRSYTDRVSVASQCYGLLKPNMPLLVDEIHDPVGHAYSGMPARLYVIDRQGKVAYKGGRGPFGFKAGEMEQALLMTLLADQVPEKK